MTGDSAEDGLGTIRRVEQEMDERLTVARAEADQRVTSAEEEAGRLVTLARHRGEERAAQRYRAQLAEADAIAERVRAEAAARSARFREESAARLDEVASRLLAVILPGEP